MNASLQHQDIRAEYKDGTLVVANSTIERRWRWSGKGLVTEYLADLAQDRVWSREQSIIDADWQLPGIDDLPDATLVNVSMQPGTDEGFTDEHVEIVTEMTYPAVHMALRHVVWIYPDTPGLRTQVLVKATDGFNAEECEGVLTGHKRVDFIPLSFAGTQRRMFGYYNETQVRNDTCEDILKEEVFAREFKNREFHTWPSVLCFEDESGGVALVKENHKCPNQIGYDCGLFRCEGTAGVESIGWGLQPREVDDTWRRSWASWCIVYGGGDRARETAFKAFDSKRYPIDPARDMYVQANTWGSGYAGEESRLAAVESAVLKELESCADLGIDTLQIDDGWQVPPGNRTWSPGEGVGWHPHPECYPEGWGPIRARAKELGVKLGLWAAAQPISLEDLQESYRDGGFRTYKLDFANLKNNEDIRALVQKARDFIKSTDHSVRINWDVTEVSRRYGYFFAREFGNLYLANRKPVHPPSTRYRPHTMLRDLWQLSRYINLRKIQGSVQNIDRVDPQLSDANQHTHDYCVAIMLMSSPLFFQQTVYYDEAARAQIRPLLAAYKSEREEIFRGTVYPIGEKPDNHAWSGFQNHCDELDRGYLMIFRELNNEEPAATLKLEFVAGRTLTLRNLMDGSQRTVTAGPGGEVEFQCETAPGYLFLKYE